MVVVGEAPGYQEALQGRPFTGPSGKLLEAVLEHHGLHRNEIFVTNAVLCRPEDNRNPKPSELAACAPRLKAEIDDRSPTSIIALGNFAAGAILGRPTKITTERVGPPKESKLYPGVRIVPAFHPAYCLRAADNFPALVTDIGKVVNNVKHSWEPPKYRVFDEAGEACTALQELLLKYSTWVIDIEVGFDKDGSFDHPDHYNLLCIGIGYAPGRVAVIGERALQDPGVRDLLSKALYESREFAQYGRGRPRRLVAHNGKFDLAGLLPTLGAGRLWFDTMIASYVMDERSGTHGLEWLSVELLGAPSWKNEIARYLGDDKNYGDIPRELLYKYNASDVACTWLLMDYFEREMQGQLRELHDFLVAAGDELMWSEIEGVRIDLGYLDYLTDHYLEGLAELEEPLNKWVFNPRSPKQVKEALRDMGIVVADTQADTLEHLQERIAADTDAGEFLRLMLLHRREQKLYGTYVKGIRKRLYKGRVYPTYLLHGTTTGRLACRNPNLQNIPRESKIRRQFVPSDGNVFVQADYATIELRVIATLAQDPYLQEVFSDRTRDIHSEVATRFFGPNFTKDQRVRAKAVVYGLSYDREAFSLAQEHRWSVAEAQRYINEFFQLIPNVVKWKAEIKQQVLHEHEDLISPFGRHRRFWLITRENMKDITKQAMAFKPQSTASDITLHSLIRLRRDYGVNVRIPVHDSLMAECPADQADDVAELMKRVMEETAKDVFTDYVDFPVDVEQGTSWGDLS